MTRAFAFLDKDADGVISTDDLRQAMTEAGQKAPSLEELTEMLAEFDDDRSVARCDSPASDTSDESTSTAASGTVGVTVDLQSFAAYSQRNQRYVSFYKLCKLAQVAQDRLERRLCLSR
jgi:hypothetical protein